MSSDRISGINIGQTKLDNYEGNTKDANLNAKGSFSGRKTRKFNNDIGSYLTGSHDIQIQQDQAQKELNGRRIKVLNDNGNASKAAKEVNTSAVDTNSNGELMVADCPNLEKSLKEFEKLAKNPMARGKVGNQGWSETKTEQGEVIEPKGTGSTRNIVDPEKFKQRVQKDLTVFLGNTIKSTNTPHGLERLRLTIENTLNSKQISEPQKNHLNKLLGKQFELQLKSFPEYLAGLEPKKNTMTGNHRLARQRLAAIHEMTVAANNFDPAIVKKHKKMLKAEALNCYKDCGTHTPPKCNDLYQTEQCLNRLKYEKNSLLKPILKLTSNSPDQRMKQAEESVATRVNSLTQQLKEIPSLEHAMGKVAKRAVELMQNVTELESKIAKDQEQLQKVSQELQKMEKNTGPLRALKPSYRRLHSDTKNTGKALRKSISANNEKKSNLEDQFNSLRQHYKNQFDARSALLQKYGKSVEVLPDAPAASSLALIWKTEISKLNEHSQATEFDKACINHFLDSLADKFPREYFENKESLGVEYVQKVAKEYVRTVKADQIPFVALKRAFGRGRTLPEQQILQSNPKSESEPTPVITLGGRDFARLLTEKLDGSKNPDVTPDNIASISSQLQMILGQEKLPKDGLETLAELYESCVSSSDGNPDANYWKLDELMPALEVGIEALKAGAPPRKAYGEMEQKLKIASAGGESEGTSIPSGASGSIQVSPYINDLFRGFSLVSTGTISQNDQDNLLRQLAEAHQDSSINSNALDMVAFHLHKALQQTSNSSQPIDIPVVSDALASALNELRNQQPFAAANQRLDEKLAESNQTNSETRL